MDINEDIGRKSEEGKTKIALVAKDVIEISREGLEGQPSCDDEANG